MGLFKPIISLTQPEKYIIIRMVGSPDAVRGKPPNKNMRVFEIF